MNVLVTGGTGFIGSALTPYLQEQGHKVIILTRDKSKVKNNSKAIDNLQEINISDTIDVIINLAGAPISKRWSKAYKQELVNSRLATTSKLINLIKRLEKKPSVLISASAIGYYGSQASDKILTEDSSYQEGFTHELCSQWEQKAQEAEQYGVRTCIARLGVVLDNGGGALKEMLPAFKCGVGGKLGSGEQAFSWVHRQDVIRAFEFMMTNEQVSGIYNLTAPKPVNNNEFTRALGQALHRPTILPMPSFMVKLLFGEMGEELLLKGQAVIPQKLQKAGFSFNFETIKQALKVIFK